MSFSNLLASSHANFISHHIRSFQKTGPLDLSCVSVLIHGYHLLQK